MAGRERSLEGRGRWKGEVAGRERSLGSVVHVGCEYL